MGRGLDSEGRWGEEYGVCGDGDGILRGGYTDTGLEWNMGMLFVSDII